MPGTRFALEVHPRIPSRLKGLLELANDLVYSWDRQVRRLFVMLDADLWEECNHNPKVFLRRVSQARLEEAAKDILYLESYHRALSAYNNYLREQPHTHLDDCLIDPAKDLVAYFCAEFGFHESLPIYSGGLGILAADHCKAASDLGLPFVAVGLLYRQGYFIQRIDGQGNQQAEYTRSDFADLPILPATDADQRPLLVAVDLPGRKVWLKVWLARAGHIRLYLLDSDLPENTEADRSITYQLYGGDRTTRIQQEILLGVGGVRALRALGIHPTAWHINEGHAAFMVLERCREHVEQGLDFASALEAVAAGTVFTTHTPVPAGHDIFDTGMMAQYFSDYVKGLALDMDPFLKLGSHDGEPGFNMTALALRASRFHNGVSRIHGRVAAQMEAYIWPQIPPADNPMRHVTNGVHVPTFMAAECAGMLDLSLGGEWRNRLLDPDYWRAIDAIPDHRYWSMRQSLKSQLLDDMRRHLGRQLRRNGLSEAHIARVCRPLSPNNTDILVIGFARRFATYKRALLIFTDPERLARLLNDPDRPVLLVFAGKAHPADEPGKELIRRVHSYATRPEFEGKLFLLENYDLSMARKLVTGVDIWLNNPLHPLEASGTSGQKAGVNGVINLSVRDGWWDEAYDGENGWAITPHGEDYDPQYINREEGLELLDIIEKEVIPLYYSRNSHGYPEAWVRRSKASMRTIIPQYNAQRMLMDYIRGAYAPAARHSAQLRHDDFAPARELAQWKAKIRNAWPKVRIRRVDTAPATIGHGEPLPLRVAVHLDELTPADVVVECLIGKPDERGEFEICCTRPFTHTGGTDQGDALFELDLIPELPGLQYYQLRTYPYHELLAHRFEMGYMLWV